MTVEELIEALSAMPSTSLVEVETADWFEEPVSVKYEFGTTRIVCDEQEPKE